MITVIVISTDDHEQDINSFLILVTLDVSFLCTGTKENEEKVPKVRIEQFLYPQNLALIIV